MRILLTSQSSGFGGVERRWIKEAKLLKSMSNEVFWSTPRFPGDNILANNMEEMGATRIWWNPYKFIERQQIHFPFSISGNLVSHCIKRLNIDLAHVALVWTSVGMTRVRELGKLGIPVVLSLRCTYPKQSFPDAVLKEINLALKGVIGAYAVSEQVKQSFLDNFGDGAKHFEIQVIHNGVSTENFAPGKEGNKEIRAHYKIPDSAFLLAFCGRLDPMKGAHFALDLIESSELTLRNVNLIFIGDGPELDSLKARIVNTPMMSRVTFAGLSDRVPEILKASNAYLSCSRLEGYSSSTAEAIATGLPTFLPNQPFFSMFSSCNAVQLLPPESHKDWIQAIARHIDAGEQIHQQLADIARKFAVAELDERSMYNNLQNFYNLHAQ